MCSLVLIPSPRSLGGMVWWSVCVRKILGKLRTLVASRSYCQTLNYTRIKNNKRLLLKPSSYKVITIFITYGYCFQTWEDFRRHLDTSKHDYSCIMAIASKAPHQSKQILGSGCYNIEHWLQAFLHYFLAPQRLFSQQFWGLLFVERFTGLIEDLSFFFEIKQRLKCKTYSIKILKSFSVISKYWLVNLYITIIILLYELTCRYNFITLCFVHIK